MLKFKEVPRDAVENTYKRTKLQIFLEKFIDANIPVAEVEWEGHYVDASSASSSLNGAVKRFKRGVKCMMVGDKVYLINKILFEKENKENE